MAAMKKAQTRPASSIFAPCDKRGNDTATAKSNDAD